MNVRKLLDWRKLLIYSHRWMGIAFGLVFVSWFVSGVAFMYWGMPQVSVEERLERQDVVDLSGAAVEPAAIAESRGIPLTSLAVEMRDGRPVYRIGQTVVFADNGESVHKRVNANIALDIVRRWAPGHAATARVDARMEEADQWTLQSGQRRQLPFYRIGLNDPANTYYYVAEDTGEIVMKTDRESRIKGFLSGVLHWLYFTPIRKHTFLWNQIIIWGSFAGGLMCLVGLALGVWRFSIGRRFRRKGRPHRSPYAGLMGWHHYSGLLFGLVTFTWIISGAFSVNPFGMFSGGGAFPGGAGRSAISGGPIRLESVTISGLSAGLDAIREHFHPKEADVGQFRGRLYMEASPPPGTPASQNSRLRGLKVWLDAPADGTFTTFDHSAMEQIASEMTGEVTVQDRAWLHEYDNYYRSRDGSRSLPVYRVRHLDENRTWMYFDPQTGSVSTQTRSSRLNRWLYAALHEFDFPFLYERRPLWDLTVILLSIGGIVLSGSTLWPMCKRLGRHGRRLGRRVAGTLF